ncbi:prophage CP4-57 regulatory [Ralstonia sp. NT80]|uniref:helix-turn-helix transcriptional regulator n=1 Tax=Ralstonia sp. NT80 TaxID=1218247 RepID=UPI00073F35A8|nr:AlpA family transcriptional regulator [Ralstonia sp. NT80]GAQ30257.1 prophage CP4-57 regulatory [Ralstonia sp. NT80]
MNTAPQRRLIRMPEVMKMAGIGKTAIYGRIKEHTFPQPVKVGRASTWVESDVQKWVDEQIAASREEGDANH